MPLSGSLSEVGASAVLMLRRGQSATVILSVADGDSFEGTIQVEKSPDQQRWNVTKDDANVVLQYTYPSDGTFDGADTIVTATIKNIEATRLFYRFNAPVLEQDAVVYSAVEATDDVIATILSDHLGRAVIGVRQDGGMVALSKLWTPSGIGADDGDLLVEDVTISAADIAATTAGKFGHANGYPLVPAVGADKTPVFVGAVLVSDRDTAAFTDGGDITVNLSGGGAAQSGLVSAANSLGAATDKQVAFYPLATAAVALVANAGLNLVASAAFTNPGTAAGVVRVRVWYRVYTLGLA